MENRDFIEELHIGANISEINQAVKQLVFFIASARVRGVHLLCVRYGQGQDAAFAEKLRKSFARILNGMKKREEIVLALPENELFDEGTKAQYLRQKYPFLADEEKSIEGYTFYVCF